MEKFNSQFPVKCYLLNDGREVFAGWNTAGLKRVAFCADGLSDTVADAATFAYSHSLTSVSFDGVTLTLKGSEK